MKYILFSLAFTASLTAWESAKVVQPYGTQLDGDTFFLQKDNAKPFKVRLIGLDAFETKMNHRVFKQLDTLKLIHPKDLRRKKPSVKMVLFFGHEAKRFIQNRILGKTVKYYDYGVDKYERRLVYIENINYLLIRYGLAVQYPTNKLHKVRKDFLLEASRKANLEQRGFYAREVQHGKY